MKKLIAIAHAVDLLTLANFVEQMVMVNVVETVLIPVIAITKDVVLTIVAIMANFKQTYIDYKIQLLLNK